MPGPDRIAPSAFASTPPEDHPVGAGESPDAPRRGALRIYLGAAPGVGKTYAMLREAHRLRDEGQDVVIGFVETHGRADTAAQIGDLELVPRRVIAYRGVLVEEMDTDAILARTPQVAIVDELAHTNVPGAARAKRWQDVERLRDAGIDVISALNVQHIASLQDVVADMTGITVRETVPDRVVAAATEIQLVDLPIEALLDRIDLGKVYPPEQARRARERFFQPGTLTALRELALRRTAEGVDERLAGMMLGLPDAITGPLASSATTDRVVVILDDRVTWGAVLRRGWRLASALHGELIVLDPVPEGGVGDTRQREQHRQFRELAHDLGATVADLPAGGEPGDAMVEALRRLRATMCIIGVAPDHRHRRHWFGASPPSPRDLAMQVLRDLPSVAVHLVSTDDAP